MDKASMVKNVFGIPDRYVMSDIEEEKLFQLVCEASTRREARLYRMLDCSAFCREKLCYFCSNPDKWCAECLAIHTRK